MLKKLFGSRFKYIILPLLIFGTLVMSYSVYAKSLTISYWDEFLWVGRSFFFERFIEADFGNKVWKTKESYDQPKLAEYAYGAWLYRLAPNDYAGFLVKSGLPEYKNGRVYSDIEREMDGTPDEWIQKYGQNIGGALDLIQRARYLNVLLLSGAVIFGYFLVLENAGVVAAIIFSFFYGFNTLLINTSLKAHSEALFIFLFNGALLLMSLYFSRGKKIKHLILFSLLSGLCTSVKLTGFMLPLIFLAVNLTLLLFNKKDRIKHLLSGFIPGMAALIIFIALNPFAYPNPLANIKFMFDWRGKISLRQANYYGVEIAYGLPIIKRIFSNYFFSNSSSFFNGLKTAEGITYSFSYGYFLFFFFILGIVKLLGDLMRRKVVPLVILSAFPIILALMSFYLVLDWPRYYVQLQLFIVLFQVLGLLFLLDKIWYVLRLYRPLLRQFPLLRTNDRSSKKDKRT